MARVTDEITISLGYLAPDGFLQSIDDLIADPALRRVVLEGGVRTGALMFEDHYEQVFAEGLVDDLAETLLKAAPEALRAGRAVHHLPFEDDSPIDLIPDGDTLTAVDLFKETSVTMPLGAALEALEAEAAAFAQLGRVPVDGAPESD